MIFNRTLLRLACVAFFMSMLLALPALADCVGDGTASITCDTTTENDGFADDPATDTNGTIGSGGDDTITIDEGATVEDELLSGVAVAGFGGDETVNNNGTIDADGVNATTGILGTDSTTVNGDGEIHVTTDTGDAYGINSGSVTVNDSQQINVNTNDNTSEAWGILADNGVFIEDEDVTITVTSAGYAAGVTSTTGGVFNQGTIDVTADAGATGVISSIGMINSGEITATGGTTGVGVTGAVGFSLLNSGTIEGSTIGVLVGGADPSTVQNFGVITGGSTAIISGSGETIVGNSGTINGDVELGAADDTMLVFDGEINGMMDGGEGGETDGDRLVFNFTVRAESDEEMEDFRAALDAVNPNGGTITLDGMTLRWTNFEEFEDLVELIRMYYHDTYTTVTVTVDVTRINYPDVAAPMTGYCVAGGITLYQIVDAQGVGTGFVSLADIQAAVADFVFAPVYLGGTTSASLYLTSATTLELRGVGYSYSFPVGYCG